MVTKFTSCIPQQQSLPCAIQRTFIRPPVQPCSILYKIAVGITILMEYMDLDYFFSVGRGLCYFLVQTIGLLFFTYTCHEPNCIILKIVNDTISFLIIHNIRRYLGERKYKCSLKVMKFLPCKNQNLKAAGSCQRLLYTMGALFCCI